MKRLKKEDRAGLYITVIVHLTVIIILLASQLSLSLRKEESFLLDFSRQETLEKLEQELESFKQVRAGNNVDQIKTAMESFSKSTYDVFGKIYQQQSAQGGNPGDAGFNPNGGANVNDDGTVDSEFTDN